MTTASMRRSAARVAPAFLIAPLLAVLPGSQVQANAPAGCGSTRDAYVGSTYSGTTKDTGELMFPDGQTFKVDTQSTMEVKFSKDRKSNYWAHVTMDGKYKEKSGYVLSLTHEPSVEFTARVHEPGLTQAWEMEGGKPVHIDKLDSVGKFLYSFKLAAKDCPAGSKTPQTLESTQGSFGVVTTTKLTRQN